jgi:dTDP-glucose 4,6-dehydratase
MRVLIAGGAGFIGSHAVKHFVDMGDDVTVVDALTYAGDLKRIRHLLGEDQFFKADIRDMPAMSLVYALVRPEVVVNFAAETHVDNSIVSAQDFITTNFEGACNLMKLCRDQEPKHKALYVHLSTDEVYGVPDQDASRGFVETDPLGPRNPYSATKAAADLMLAANKNTHGQEFLAIRPSNNFGPHQHEEKFLPKLIRCLVSQPDGSKTDFPLYGDGRQVREWTYAPDTAKIIRHAIMNGWRGFHNVSSKVSFQNVRIISMVKAMLEAEGKLGNPDAVTFVKDRPGHDRRYWIESKIDPVMFTLFDTALAETVEHYFQRFA